MNQTTAKKKAYEGNIRVGYLRELLNKANNTGVCKINPSLPRAKAIEMFPLLVNVGCELKAHTILSS